MVLHILTSDEIVARPNFLNTAESLIDALGSHGAFHLRTRLFDGRALLTLALHLAEKSRSVNGTFIVNGRPDIALASSAHGVQLGSTALTASDVRSFAPKLLIGTSVRSIQEIKNALAQDGKPDWFILGHLFKTRSHPNSRPKGIELLRRAVEVTDIPIIAVGGILPTHLRTLEQAGAAGVAVISGIWDAKEPITAVSDYLL